MAQNAITDTVEDVYARLINGIRRERLIEKAADDARVLLEERTRQGVDRWGRQFWPYSPSYAKQEKSGRRSPVTLFNDGPLPLPARTRKQGGGDIRSQRTVELRPRDAETERLWAIHNEGRGVPIREFLGLTPQQEERVARNLRARALRTLPRATRRRVRIHIGRL